MKQPLETPGTAAAALAAVIDHTVLAPTAPREAIDRACDEALQHGFRSVCVNGRWVAVVAGRLRTGTTFPCAVVGFPLGASSARAMQAETRAAIEDGAREIDMVMSIGDALAGHWSAVGEGIDRVRGACGGVPLKVIIEACYLNEDQKRTAAALCRRLEVAFVKTSTGFGPGGATIADVKLLRECVGDDLGVKAAGGIRDLATARAMLDAGASRLGCSAGVDIITALGAGQQ